MKTSVLYRVASILLLLFAAAHTLGFRQTDPQWGVGPLIGEMQAIHFDVQGFSRTYWNFYVGFGLFVSVLLVFAALLAWQLAGLSADTLARMRGITWGFAICFVVVTILNWRYFFFAPIISSALICVCLIVAAWRSPESSSPRHHKDAAG